jgi:hypothetical protein
VVEGDERNCEGGSVVRMWREALLYASRRCQRNKRKYIHRLNSLKWPLDLTFEANEFRIVRYPPALTVFDEYQTTLNEHHCSP